MSGVLRVKSVRAVQRLHPLVLPALAHRHRLHLLGVLLQPFGLEVAHRMFRLAVLEEQQQWKAG